MKSIFAIIETIENRAAPSAPELISFAENISGNGLLKIYLVVAGQSIGDTADRYSRFGHDVIVLEHDSFRYPNPELLAGSITGLIGAYEPRLICFPHTMRSSHAAALIAATNGYSCITGVDAYRTRGAISLFRKPICNGKINIELTPVREGAVVTVLPGAFPSPSIDDGTHPGTVEHRETAPGSVPSIPLGIRDSADGSVRLEESDVIVSAGRGIGGRENLELIKAVAKLFDNAAVGASRPICDLKWLPYAHQVGSTGRTVSPRLYIACGISGASQHLAGMKGSQTVVAVNTDPQASINSIADFIVIEDLRVFLPVLIHKIKEMKKQG